MGRIYHVAKTGCDWNRGTAEQPFLTISKAAKVAEAGDTVLVHEGVYREWVKPEHRGEGEQRRITYQAAEGEKVIIKGSEQITTWEPVEGNVWKVVLPNSFFGDYNPYDTPILGDWLIKPDEWDVHTGDVYLNGKSFYEATCLEDVKNPQKREFGFRVPWKVRPEAVEDPEQSVYQWFAEVDHENTTIYANFQGTDPNKELTEINVRRSVFYPEKNGINYITVRGFELAQAATPWAPPTADQPGLIGPNWAKGWIIEDNIIHDAKCSAVSIGKEASTGHNERTIYCRKPGYQNQQESVFRALQIGWSKETIGSHIIRNNTIYNCGQNGIVGHLGCAFSRIYHNRIYNVARKHEYFGHEIAGIKLHAALDVQIFDNYIHDCTLGTWLDWEAQGVRIHGNVYNHNDRDLMIEVTHGPCLVENNIFMSNYNFDNVAQGTAFVNNLCCGLMRRVKVLDRSTPYHFPHTTQVLGYALVLSGDDRLYNNIFAGIKDVEEPDSTLGTVGYNGCTTSIEEFEAAVRGAHSREDQSLFRRIEQPAYVNANVYYQNAEPFDKEQDKAVVTGFDPKAKVVEDGDGVYLEIECDESMFTLQTQIHGTSTLGAVRLVNAEFETPEGTPIVLDTDITGAKRGGRPVPGPVEGLKPGKNRIRLTNLD